METMDIDIPQSLKDAEPKMQASHRSFGGPRDDEPSDWGKETVAKVKQTLRQE